MKSENSAGAVIFFMNKNNEPKFLLLKYANYWGFPKGWIEKNETPEQAAKREIKEETNLNVLLIPKFREEQRWFYQLEGKTINKRCIYFMAEIQEKQKAEIKVSSEHEDFVFAGFNEIRRYVKIKQNLELLKKAYSFIKEHKKQERLF